MGESMGGAVAFDVMSRNREEYEGVIFLWQYGQDETCYNISAPTAYGRKPRLGTAREILETTERISKSVSKFDSPFIILHGLSDQDFYNESCSKDKQIKLYKGMNHALTYGNNDDEIETVFDDAISCALERSKTPVEGLLSMFSQTQTNENEMHAFQ
ncbi:hypothetical protein QTG54_005096 [Skeletonema marinoi]|uniref:Serine aminopeptidase S33 domain-containing protein n=1 Tax=Skeletonema marinoi TaxID=267567 RepID=A0AAD8YE16_9STRA|nr:hypothetical protein QTG54_005096 [Skeletonema marinoi]